MLTTFVAPILRKGAFVGVAGVDTDLSDVIAEISNIQFYETGYAALISETGMVIAHPDEKLSGTATLEDFAELDRLNAALESGGNGYVETTDPYTGAEAVMFYATLPTSGWRMVATVPRAEMMASVRQPTWWVLGLGVLAFVGLAGDLAELLDRFDVGQRGGGAPHDGAAASPSPGLAHS